MKILNYFQVVVDSSSQAKKDRANHAATLMDLDPFWNSNDYKEENWTVCNGGTKWYSTNPASDATQAVVTAWLDPAKDYNAPEFAVFRSGKGDGQGFRAPMSEVDFDTFRAEVVIEVQKTEDWIMTNHSLALDKVGPV